MLNNNPTPFTSPGTQFKLGRHFGRIYVFNFVVQFRTGAKLSPKPSGRQSDVHTTAVLLTVLKFGFLKLTFVFNQYVR